MSSLLNSLSSNNIEKVSASIPDNSFTLKLSQYGDSVISLYNKANTSLNEGIAKIAQTEKLLDDQIQRIVEYVNNHVYLEKYAKMRNFPEREVVFDLASLPGVKDVINGKLEKAASESSVLNFLNYSGHDTGSLSPDKKKELKQIFAEKLASEMNQLNEEFDKTVQSYADGAYTIASALIQYDRMYKNAQEIFEELCTEANIKKVDQIIFKEATEQKIAQMKEYKELPQDYTLEIKLAEEKPKSKFSLGDKSYMKPKKKLDTIITDDKKVIKGIQSLISAAQKMQEDKSKMKTLSDSKENLKKVGANHAK